MHGSTVDSSSLSLTWSLPEETEQNTLPSGNVSQSGCTVKKCCGRSSGSRKGAIRLGKGSVEVELETER